MMGIWLLIPEHLRLGTWDLLCGWTGKSTEKLDPRLALQVVHESALCVSGVRQKRTLSQKGFEVANGLPFVATDKQIHSLLSGQTIKNTQLLQIALGQLRRASSHFKANLLAIDPHRLQSYSKRQMQRRRSKVNEKSLKTLQTFFCLDTDTHQPVAFTIGSGAKTISSATQELLLMSQRIFEPEQGKSLLLADNEHYTTDIFKYVNEQTNFDLLVAMPQRSSQQNKLKALSPDLFTPRWPGLATACLPFRFQSNNSKPLYQLVQRLGEKNFIFKNFLSTSKRDELTQLCYDYPARWHIEEFFNTYQAMGWGRAGTLNLNIRYAQLTLALVAQSVVHQLRKRLGEPFDKWEASHLGKNLFQGLDGDVRVQDDTIIVTFYNAPNLQRLRENYENLPQKLTKDNIDPRVPWLYNFKLDFRFK